MIRIPLQFRVAVITGGFIAALQFVLFGYFDGTLMESEALRLQSLQLQARSAVAARIDEASRRQRSNLELIADFGRQQPARIVHRPAEPADNEDAQESTEPPGFWARLFGAGSEDDTPPDDTPDKRPTRIERLSDRIPNLTEHAGAWPIIWYISPQGSTLKLDAPLRDKARALEKATLGTAEKMFCDAGDCLLLTVRPFKTRDEVQIILVAMQRLSELVAQASEASSQTISYSLQPPGGKASSDPAGQDIAALSGVAFDGGTLSVRISDDSDAQRLANLRTRYRDIALLGTLITLLVLALSMRSVVARITRLGQALPMLANGEYTKARTRLGREPGKLGVRDESTDAIAVAHDVSTQLEELTRRLSREAGKLRHERDQTGLLLDSVPVCVALLDEKAEMLTANATCRKALGVVDLSSQNASMLLRIDPEQRTAFAAAVSGALQGPGKHRIETRLAVMSDPPRIIAWQLMAVSGYNDLQNQVLAIGEDISDLRAAERLQLWLRDHDQTTELLNRQALASRLVHTPAPAVLVLAVPGQQAMIDSLPDLRRREWLRELGQTLEQTSQENRITAWSYLGNHRFACVIHGNEADARDLVQQRLQRLALKIPTDNGPGITPELDLLCCRLDAQLDLDTAGDLIDAAERAEVHAGEATRWTAASALLSELEDEYRTWVGRLDQSIREERFVLAYQPIFSATNLRWPVHSEVLVRILDADGDLISPERFVRHAEVSGQVVQMDHLVARAAMAKLQTLQQAGLDHRLAINLSAKTLQNPQFIPQFERAAAEFNLKPASLVLELTETEAFNNIVTARHVMKSMTNLGLSFAMDDFGIGFNSFEYLRELPFEYIKIDQLFVKHLATRPSDRRFIQSIHELAKDLGFQTIAEGVEDMASVTILQDIGIDALQGFALGRPVLDLPSLHSGKPM